MTLKRASAVVLLLLAVSCSGPRTPLDVGIKEINTDVVIGPIPPRVVAAPPAAPPRPVGFPPFVQPPVNPEPPPSSPPVSCPRANALAPVRHAVTTEASVPPAVASYRFLNQGTWTVGERTGAFPATSTRNVSNIVNAAEGGGFTFEVAIPDPASGLTTTTTYHVYPSQPQPIDPTPGIYIDAVVSERGGTVEQTFTPVPPLLLMQFPAAIDVTWSSRGVDPQTQTVMQFDARIARQGVVDACGTKLAAWVVDVTNGSITSPTTQVTFSATLHIAPQYGGLVLADNVLQTGTVRETPAAPALPIETSNRSRIAVEPRFP